MDIDIALEEKKLEEEEIKLQRLKEDALRQKQSQHEELNRLREARKKQVGDFEVELKKYQAELQVAKEELAREEKNYDDLLEQKNGKHQLWQLENTAKETEIKNMKQRLANEKQEF